MLGEHLSEETPPPLSNDAAAELVLEARRINVADEAGRVRVRDATISLRGGELLGIAAIEGSGQQELLRVLAGRILTSSGEILRHGDVGYIPADRHRDAVMLSRSLVENVALRDAGLRRGWVDWQTWDRHTATLMQAFDVRAPGGGTPMDFLSGGNQQKLVVARELSGNDTTVIIADNPTRGLDVRAAADVHRRLRHAATRGAGVLVYSSDIDELLLLATRVMVLRDGNLYPVTLDRDAIGRAMLGADQHIE
jgi:simple sugar transport system ATP-binding protein